MDERYKNQIAYASEKTEDVSKESEEPGFLDDLQNSPSDTVGDLAGEDYPQPSKVVERYREGFIVTGGRRSGKVWLAKSPTAQIIVALYRRFDMVPNWQNII